MKTRRSDEGGAGRTFEELQRSLNGKESCFIRECPCAEGSSGGRIALGVLFVDLSFYFVSNLLTGAFAKQNQN